MAISESFNVRLNESPTLSSVGILCRGSDDHSPTEVCKVREAQSWNIGGVLNTPSLSIIRYTNTVVISMGGIDMFGKLFVFY